MRKKERFQREHEEVSTHIELVTFSTANKRILAAVENKKNVK